MLFPATCGGSILGPLTGRGSDLVFDERKSVRELSGPQAQIYTAGARNVLLTCGRRFGKTHLALIRLRNWGMVHPEGNYWYVAPTYRAAKRIAWKRLKKLIDPAYVAGINNTELRIDLWNGATLTLFGADNPDSLRGDSLSGAVIDEAAFTKPELWTEVLQPALSDQEGPCWQITTPKGFNHYHELWESVEDDPDWARFSFSTIQGGRVSEAEIEKARNHLDPRTFRQEYEASFEAAAGRAYYDFGQENIWEGAEDIGGTVYVGLDFNVSVMAGVVCSILPGKRLVQWDEINMPNSNTDEVGAYLAERFRGRKVVVCPDPTGNSRKTSAEAGVTDHTILRKHGLRVLSPGYDWSVKDKLNATNALIHTADGQRHYRIHPRCKKTIKGLRGVCTKEGSEGFAIDKKPGIEHWTDGLGYLALSACNRLKGWRSGTSNFSLV
jgi:hypothetical protein